MEVRSEVKALYFDVQNFVVYVVGLKTGEETKYGCTIAATTTRITRMLGIPVASYIAISVAWTYSISGKLGFDIGKVDLLAFGKLEQILTDARGGCTTYTEQSQTR